LGALIVIALLTWGLGETIHYVEWLAALRENPHVGMVIAAIATPFGRLIVMVCVVLLGMYLIYSELVRQGLLRPGDLNLIDVCMTWGSEDRGNFRIGPRNGCMLLCQLHNGTGGPFRNVTAQFEYTEMSPAPVLPPQPGQIPPSRRIPVRQSCWVGMRKAETKWRNGETLSLVLAHWPTNAPQVLVPENRADAIHNYDLPPGTYSVRITLVTDGIRHEDYFVQVTSQPQSQSPFVRVVAHVSGRL
jgi:hypothetical protein